jgi:Domain of unknown function (DUF4258)
MTESKEVNPTTTLERLWSQAKAGDVRVTQHAQQEMVEEDVTFDEVLQAIGTAQILENYPEHRRGSCCLLNGITENQRPLHIVCTTAQPVLIIITIYEPKLPKWVSPTQRRR